MSKVVTYAQNREDVILAGFFDENEKGFYVDIGAFHSSEDSVTKYFYDRGWRGINIEPNKLGYRELAENRPEDINLNLGVGSKPGKLKLRVYDDALGLSTFSKDMQSEYKEAHSPKTDGFHENEVEIKTLKDILESCNASEIQFLKVDIEGYEYEALLGNDWDRFRPEVICIESNHIIKDWRPLLAKVGYEKVFFDGLNEYYVVQEASNRAKKFSYVQSIIGRDVISAKHFSELKKLQDGNEQLELRLDRYKEVNREQNIAIAHLNAHIHEQLRTKNLIKNLLRAVDNKILRGIKKVATPARYYPSMESDQFNSVGAEELLLAINYADTAALKGHPNVISRVRATMGLSLLRLHGLVRKVLKKFLKLMFRLIKKLMGRG